jgi:RadC-like JAB domain
MKPLRRAASFTIVDCSRSAKAESRDLPCYDNPTREGACCSRNIPNSHHLERPNVDPFVDSIADNLQRFQKVRSIKWSGAQPTLRRSTPSKDDMAMTEAVAAVAEKLVIMLHDHVVVGRKGHASLRSLGLLS